MKVKVTHNLDKLFEKIQKQANEISGPVSFDVLFNQNFMSKHSNFSSFDELLKVGNYTVNSKDDFEAIPESELDTLISEHTNFNSWEEMKVVAGKEYALSKLNF